MQFTSWNISVYALRLLTWWSKGTIVMDAVSPISVRDCWASASLIRETARFIDTFMRTLEGSGWSRLRRSYGKVVSIIAWLLFRCLFWDKGEGIHRRRTVFSLGYCCVQLDSCSSWGGAHLWEWQSWELFRNVIFLGSTGAGRTEYYCTEWFQGRCFNTGEKPLMGH